MRETPFAVDDAWKFTDDRAPVDKFLPATYEAARL